MSTGEGLLEVRPGVFGELCEEGRKEGGSNSSDSAMHWHMVPRGRRWRHAVTYEILLPPSSTILREQGYSTLQPDHLLQPDQVLSTSILSSILINRVYRDALLYLLDQTRRPSLRSCRRDKSACTQPSSSRAKKNMQCIKSLQPSTSLLLASPLLYSPTGSLPCAGMEAHITIRPLKPMP